MAGEPESAHSRTQFARDRCLSERETPPRPRELTHACKRFHAATGHWVVGRDGQLPMLIAPKILEFSNARNSEPTTPGEPFEK